MLVLVTQVNDYISQMRAGGFFVRIESIITTPNPYNEVYWSLVGQLDFFLSLFNYE